MSSQVEEIQDNSGATDDGTVAADQTLTKLVAAIAAAGGPTYQWASIDPVNDADGGQPGGNIRSVFLYNADRVTFVSKPGGDSTTSVSVSTGADGTAELSISPGRVDPTNEAWATSRKPLAGEFTFGGKKVIIVANHFKSKGGDQSADGRFQPPNRTSEVQRTKQATVLNGFVKNVLGADPDASIVLAGDFNDYQFSGPIKTLTDDGATLTDLINTLPENERYTYNFNGVSQVLDHIFVSKPLVDVQYDVVHVNSEFAAQSSDHDPQVVRFRPAAKVNTTKLNLLNINDFHGRIDNNTVKFAGTVEQLRAAGGENSTLFLAAGDNISASLFASASQNDQPTIDVLNARAERVRCGQPRVRQGLRRPDQPSRRQPAECEVEVPGCQRLSEGHHDTGPARLPDLHRQRSEGRRHRCGHRRDSGTGQPGRHHSGRVR
jgi:hypothetical protein